MPLYDNLYIPSYLAIGHRLFLGSGPRLCKLTKSLTCFFFVRIVSISIPPSGFCWLVISPPLLLIRFIIACALIYVNILNFTVLLQMHAIYGTVSYGELNHSLYCIVFSLLTENKGTNSSR